MPRHLTRVSAVSSRRPQRRKLVWATDNFSGVSVAAGAKLPMRDLLANLEVAGSSVLGATIMRTHMKLSVTWADADTNPGFYYGFIVNTAPTVTNLDPSVTFGDDWMLNSVLTPGTARTVYHPAGAAVNFFSGETIDLRAKRKVEELSEKYWFVLLNAGSASLGVSGFTKVLLALP